MAKHRLVGKPALSLDARRLVFVDEECVLDTYRLRPSSPMRLKDGPSSGFAEQAHENTYLQGKINNRKEA